MKIKESKLHKFLYAMLIENEINWKNLHKFSLRERFDFGCLDFALDLVVVQQTVERFRLFRQILHSNLGEGFS